MPWYVADFTADTQHLDSSLTGAYMMLIGHYWLRGSLPDDDSALARIARMSPPQWKKARPVLVAFFHDGWKHKRIDEEIAHAADVSKKRRAAVEQREINRSSNDDQKITQPQPPSQAQESKQVGNFRKVGEVKANGPRHGAVSPSRGTVFIRKGTDDWETYVEDYRRAFGVEPEPNQHGGFWFKIVGVDPIPLPKRLQG